MIHLSHPAIAHLPVATVLVIFHHNLFSLPATTPPERLGYFSNLFEDGTNGVFQKLAFKLQTPGNKPKENILYKTRCCSLSRCYRVKV
jgi:hypothetical protein